jgi:hypothetical protein
MPAAQRRRLQAPARARKGAESDSDESGSSSAEEGGGGQKKSKRQIAQEEEVRARTQKVSKVRKGCERLMKAKNTGPEDKASLLADLDLLCGSGGLDLDLPHGEGALEHLLPHRQHGGDILEARLDLDSADNTIMMRSGYALAPGMAIAVLVDPESQNIHDRWQFGEALTIAIDKAAAGQPIETQPVVQVKYYQRTKSKKDGHVWYRKGGRPDFIAPECIQCEVEFTKFNKNQAGKLRAVCARDTLQYFLDLANERSDREEYDEEEDEGWSD